VKEAKEEARLERERLLSSYLNATEEGEDSSSSSSSSPRLSIFKKRKKKQGKEKEKEKDVSAPFQIIHNIHVDFNSESGFSGLPPVRPSIFGLSFP